MDSKVLDITPREGWFYQDGEALSFFLRGSLLQVEIDQGANSWSLILSDGDNRLRVKLPIVANYTARLASNMYSLNYIYRRQIELIIDQSKGDRIVLALPGDNPYKPTVIDSRALSYSREDILKRLRQKVAREQIEHLERIERAKTKK